MCKTCLRDGWRGIWDKGRALLKEMSAKHCWVTTSRRVDGKQQVHSPDLKDRLKRLWDFLRLQHRLHLKEESGTAAHCLKMNIGSVADDRLDEPCRHPHPDPNNCPAVPPMCETSKETCCAADCTKRASCSCRHCPVSFCRKHLESTLCRSEHLPPAGTMDSFVCPKCRPNVDAHRHSAEGCASCSEIEFFKEDLLKCVRRTKCPELLGKAQVVCRCIDSIVGHNARK